MLELGALIAIEEKDVSSLAKILSSALNCLVLELSWRVIFSVGLFLMPLALIINALHPKLFKHDFIVLLIILA